MRFARTTLYYWLIPAALFLGGCSGEKPPEKNAAVKASPAASKTAAAANNSGKQDQVLRHSDFATDARLRDPFFPNAKRTADPVVAASKSPQQPANLEKQLHDGFQGVFGAGADRIAMINNVMLEPGRTVSIPLGTGTQRTQVAVRVKEVLSTSVVLEAQGKTITISSGRK